jgi:hypothetical protein
LGYVGYSGPGYSTEGIYENVYLDGIQFGLRVEPLFKYGFGLNTGLLLEAYAKSTDSDWNEDSELEIEYDRAILNIPLHFEYRLNFSKWFNMFAYGGAGFNAITNSTFDEYSFATTYEYGGGFRISHVQFNVGFSKHLSDISNMQYFADMRTFPKMTFSISYMF